MLLYIAEKSKIRIEIKAEQKETCSAAGVYLHVLFMLGYVPAVHHDGTCI